VSVGGQGSRKKSLCVRDQQLSQHIFALENELAGYLVLSRSWVNWEFLGIELTFWESASLGGWWHFLVDHSSCSTPASVLLCFTNVNEK